jgi:hypothetical protein
VGIEMKKLWEREREMSEDGVRSSEGGGGGEDIMLSFNPAMVMVIA